MNVLGVTDLYTFSWLVLLCKFCLIKKRGKSFIELMFTYRALQINKTELILAIPHKSIPPLSSSEPTNVTAIGQVALGRNLENILHTSFSFSSPIQSYHQVLLILLL